LSLYQLTIEDGTVFGDRFVRGLLKGLPEEGLSADMYLATQDICESAGLPAYEISNHARPGAQSRHNLIYWNAGDYAGIGPGAHGRLTIDGKRYAVEAPRAPSEWLKLVESGGPAESRDSIAAHGQATEYLIMGLRVQDGINLERYAEISGQQLDRNIINHLISLDKVSIRDGRLAATAEGRLVLNAVISALAP
jgi:oxygen-independent coproporphyrinogen-3 oxidase